MSRLLPLRHPGTFLALAVIGLFPAQYAASEPASPDSRGEQAARADGDEREAAKHEVDGGSRARQGEDATSRGETKPAAARHEDARRIEPLMLLLHILRSPK